MKAKLPKAFVEKVNNLTSLHFTNEWMEGAMYDNYPNELVIEYTQQMMAWLLLVNPRHVQKMHALQLGLGAASLTKFCYNKIGMRTSAIEINPSVIRACLKEFELPANNERLHVIEADAAIEIRKMKWVGAVDALQVDVYGDTEGPALDNYQFYHDCRETLTETGCMAVNLISNKSVEPSLRKILRVFGHESILAINAPVGENTIVLAQRNVKRPSRALLEKRAILIQDKWGLPADKWIDSFKSLS